MDCFSRLLDYSSGGLDFEFGDFYLYCYWFYSGYVRKMVEGAGGGSDRGKNQNLNSQKLALELERVLFLREADFLLVLLHHKNIAGVSL